MRKFLLIAGGLFAFGTLWKKEAEEDGAGIALSPFLVALLIEAGIFLLRRQQNGLLGRGDPIL
jgi:hypothetical protein